MPTPSPPVSKKRTKGGVYTSDITFEALSSVFHLPCTKACAHLGMGLTIFKRLCRKHGLYQWPYRALKKQVAVAGHLEQAAMLRIVAACRQPPTAPQQAAVQGDELWRDDSSSSGAIDMQGVVIAGLEDSDDAASPRSQPTALGQLAQASPSQQQSQGTRCVVPTSPACAAASEAGGQLGLLLSAMQEADDAKAAQQQQQPVQPPLFKMPAPIRTTVPRSSAGQAAQHPTTEQTPPLLPATPVCPAARRADKRSAELLHRRLLTSAAEQLMQSAASTPPAQYAYQQQQAQQAQQAQALERGPGLQSDFIGLLMQLNQMAGSLDVQIKAATAAAAMRAQLQQPAAGLSPMAAAGTAPSFAEALTRLNGLQQVPVGSPLASAARYHFTPTASPPSVTSRTQLPAAWLAFQSPFAMQQLQQAQAQAQARALLSASSGSLSLASLQGCGSAGSMCPPTMTAAQQLQMQALVQGFLVNNNPGASSLAPHLSVPLPQPVGEHRLRPQ